MHFAHVQSLIFILLGQYELPGLEINFFSCSTQLSIKFVFLINLKIPTFFFQTSFKLNSTEHELSRKKVLTIDIFIVKFYAQLS